MLTKVYSTYHVHKLELSLNKMKWIGLKFNNEKSFFIKTQMGYLGFWVISDTKNPIDLCFFKSMKNMTPLTSLKEVRKFIGLVD